MLKKLLFLLFVCNLSFGQIKYPDAKQHLKEFLVMQSLLSENRIEDLKEFFSMNNYTFNGDANNLIYQKLNLDIDRKNNIVPIVIIESQNNSTNYKEKFLRIIFRFQNSNYEYSHFDELYQAQQVQDFIKNTYVLGPTFYMIPKKGEYDPDKIKVTKIDRYTVSIEAIGSPESKQIMKVSNFSKMGDSNTLFFGPGEMPWTEIYYNPPVKFKEKYRSVIEIYSANPPDNNNLGSPINIDFFMSLKNFNDKIWADK